MSSTKPLVSTTDKMFKEGVNNMETKRNVVKIAITHHKGKDNIETVNKRDKPQESKTKKDKYIFNKKCMTLDKSRTLDNSRASERNETEYTVNK